MGESKRRLIFNNRELTHQNIDYPCFIKTNISTRLGEFNGLKAR